MVTVGGCIGAGYTAVDPESRRIVPTDAQAKGKKTVKVVYTVLEAQYQVQNSLHICREAAKQQRRTGSCCSAP